MFAQQSKRINRYKNVFVSFIVFSGIILVEQCAKVAGPQTGPTAVIFSYRKSVDRDGFSCF